MTDNEIKKALECCTQQAGCSGCPFVISYEMKYRGGYACSEALRKNALDLINRQRAENESLKVDLAKCSIRLDNLYKTANEIKSEAIKDFAERICEGRVSNDPVVIAVKVELECMKEMTEVS